ncbi:MAG: penicillin-insensitive murein endopeptidase [Saprospiraceae bacterium]|nr:penicillin-insensitive murein endopeptidase [Saprospiraceae bacterium]
MTWRSVFRHPFPYIFAVLVTLIYISLWPISEWVTAKPGLVKYAEHDAPRIVGILRKGLLYPFGGVLTNTMRHALVFPYWLLLGFGIRALYLLGKPYWKYVLGTFTGILLLLYIFPGILLLFEGNLPSQSTGRVGKGSIVNAKRIPYRGANFTTYSFGGYLSGRTFVHDKVKTTVLDAYEICRETAPSTHFILGETGRKHGGAFIPHRTHQNGLSVDFMTPLLKKDRPYQRHHLFNLWGYAHEFDDKGKKGNLEVDYETMAIHLLAVKRAAKANGLRIQKVIFDPVLRPKLLATSMGKELRSLPFTKNRVIIRHDDHYHIDFKVLP